jgi:hypothetical protein
MLLILILLSNLLAVAFSSNDLNQAVFVILSQRSHRHINIAQETREKLKTNLLADGVKEPLIFDLHNDWQMSGGWTIFPLLPKLERVARPDTKWFAFLHEASEVNLEIFKEVLSKYESGI